MLEEGEIALEVDPTKSLSQHVPARSTSVSGRCVVGRHGTGIDGASRVVATTACRNWKGETAVGARRKSKCWDGYLQGAWCVEAGRGACRSEL